MSLLSRRFGVDAPCLRQSHAVIFGRRAFGNEAFLNIKRHKIWVALQRISIAAAALKQVGEHFVLSNLEAPWLGSDRLQ